jgi:pimeloyl-ACP methyl ester carboxylesterase
MRSIRAQDLHEEELRTIAAPTMIVAGERDQWLPRETAERLAAAVGDCRLEWIAGVGRLVPEEAADELAALIIAFDEGR